MNNILLGDIKSNDILKLNDLLKYILKLIYY